MRKSTTWQAIYDEGAVDSLHTALLQVGTTKFGAPSSAAHTSIRALTDQAYLLFLFERVLTAATWDELLQPIPGAARPR